VAVERLEETDQGVPAHRVLQIGGEAALGEKAVGAGLGFEVEAVRIPVLTLLHVAVVGVDHHQLAADLGHAVPLPALHQAQQQARVHGDGHTAQQVVVHVVLVDQAALPVHEDFHGVVLDVAEELHVLQHAQTIRWQ